MVKMVAVAIKPGWMIVQVLVLYLILLFTSFVRLPRSLPPSVPFRGSFDLVYLLASAGKRSLMFLDGAGRSGKLSRPVKASNITTCLKMEDV